MEPILKFNNGRGAILCHECSIIIKANLTQDEWEGKTDLFYCDKCKEKLNLYIMKKIYKATLIYDASKNV